MLLEFKDLKSWQEGRRKVLKILALTGILSSGDIFSSSKHVFAIEGEITPDEMRQKAMQLFLKEKPFQ